MAKAKRSTAEVGANTTAKRLEQIAPTADGILTPKHQGDSVIVADLHPWVGMIGL